MNLVLIVALFSTLSFATSLDKALVKDVTETLEGVSGKTQLKDCPEAKDHESLIKACRKVGVKKVLSEAKFLKVNVKKEDIKVCDVDARFFSVSKYVWYCANTSKGKITMLTQKPLFGDCF